MMNEMHIWFEQWADVFYVKHEVLHSFLGSYISLSKIYIEEIGSALLLAKYVVPCKRKIKANAVVKRKFSESVERGHDQNKRYLLNIYRITL